jgi:hypothetical protein
VLARARQRRRLRLQQILTFDSGFPLLDSPTCDLTRSARSDTQLGGRQPALSPIVTLRPQVSCLSGAPDRWGPRQGLTSAQETGAPSQERLYSELWAEAAKRRPPDAPFNTARRGGHGPHGDLIESGRDTTCQETLDYGSGLGKGEQFPRPAAGPPGSASNPLQQNKTHGSPEAPQPADPGGDPFIAPSSQPAGIGESCNTMMFVVDMGHAHRRRGTSARGRRRGGRAQR